jgi:hypothetical protein
MEFTITNNSGSEIYIETLSLSWPVANNGTLQIINLHNSPIFNVVVSSSPVSIPSQYAWSTGSGTRRLDSGQTSTLSFLFELGAQSSGYSVHLVFDNGCVINK